MTAAELLFLSRSMFNDPPVRTTATILEILGAALYRASLPNGKPVVAHLSKALTLENAAFQPGDRVEVELTPYDFDAARITRHAGGL